MRIEQRWVPFRHWVAEEVFDADRVARAWAAVPPADWHGWREPGEGAVYDNDCERHKRTCRARHLLPLPIVYLLGDLADICTDPGVATTLHGLPKLEADQTHHGGGLHVTAPGGHLQPHLDYALHPHMPQWERRLNAILFLNPLWREEWGGAFELYDDTATRAEARIYPSPGRLVLWEPTDVAYHGTQKLSGFAADRATLAVYFLAPARAGVVRKRALFVPRRSP